MGGKSPDYGDMAVAQGEANEGVVRDQTYANRPTQQTPWGYTSWESNPYTDPGSGEQTTRWTQTQGLTPELQQILNQQIAMQGGKTDIAQHMMGRMAQEYGQGQDWSGMTPMGQVPMQQYTLPEPTQRQLDYSGAPGMQDPTALRQRAEDSRYAKAASRLNPAFSSKRQEAEIKMRNQGLGPEDAAWKANMSGIDQQETDAYGQAQYDAVSGGMGEANQLYNQNMGQRNQYIGEVGQQGNFANNANAQAFSQNAAANAQNYGQNMTSSNYANQIRQQQMTEAMQKRGFSLNEINAVMSGQQVQSPQMPNFSQAGAAQPAPIYQAGVDQGNFNQAQTQGIIDGVTGIAGGFF